MLSALREKLTVEPIGKLYQFIPLLDRHGLILALTSVSQNQQITVHFSSFYSNIGRLLIRRPISIQRGLGAGLGGHGRGPPLPPGGLGGLGPIFLTSFVIRIVGIRLVAIGISRLGCLVIFIPEHTRLRFTRRVA